MARHRRNLTMRFPDAVDTWDRVIDNNGLALQFETQVQALAANFRLQHFRKAFRDTLGEGEVSPYDRFKIRVPPDEATLIIEPIPLIKPASVRTLDGEELTLRDNTPKADIPLSLDEED